MMNTIRSVVNQYIDRYSSFTNEMRNKLVYVYVITAYLAFASDPAPNNEANQVLTCQEGEPCMGYFSKAIEIAKNQPKVRNSGPSDPNKVILRNFRSEFIIPMSRNHSSGLKQQNNEIQARSTRRPDAQEWNLPGNYGCWCRVKNNYMDPLVATGVAGSKPVDLYDEGCKTHAMNMKCIVLDAAYENIECDPYTTDYDATVTTKSVETDFIWSKNPLYNHYAHTFECTQTLEEDWCKRRVCINDLALLAEATGLYYHNIMPNYNEYDNWDNSLDAQCINQNANNGRVAMDTTGLKCCGDYPYRTFYDPLDKETQCCVHSRDVMMMSHISRWRDSDNNDNARKNEHFFPKNFGEIYNQNDLTKSCTTEGLKTLVNTND